VCPLLLALRELSPSSHVVPGQSDIRVRNNSNVVLSHLSSSPPSPTPVVSPDVPYGCRSPRVGILLGGSPQYELRLDHVTLPMPLAKPVRGDRVEAMSTTHSLSRARRLRMDGRPGVVGAPIVSARPEREPAHAV
jgi:hypothetical protein